MLFFNYAYDTYRHICLHITMEVSKKYLLKKKIHIRMSTKRKTQKQQKTKTKKKRLVSGSTITFKNIRIIIQIMHSLNKHTF